MLRRVVPIRGRPLWLRWKMRQCLPFPGVAPICGRLPLLRWSHPPIPVSRCDQGQSQSQQKRRVIGTVLKKPAARSQTTPEDPILVSWRAHFTPVPREKSQSLLPEAEVLHTFCRGVANFLVGWLVIRKSQPTFFGKRDGGAKMSGTRCHHEEGRRPTVAFAIAVGIFLS